MSQTHYKICPECQSRAALAAPHCLTCRRKYNTRFVPHRAFQTARLPFTVVIAPPNKRDRNATLQLCGVLLLALGALCVSRAKNEGDPPGFQHTSNTLWTGEQLYVSVGRDQAPTPFCIILGGSDQYKAPSGQTFRAVKVRYIGGGEAWKPRDSIVHSDRYFVKPDDPALARKQWRNLTD